MKAITVAGLDNRNDAWEYGRKIATGAILWREDL